MKLPENLRITSTLADLPEHHRDQLDNPGELDNLDTLQARNDTALLLIEDTDTGRVLAYARLGLGDAGEVVIYAARSWLTGLGKMALMGLFGTATAVNKPMRVHAEKLRTYARMMGAEHMFDAWDGDGIPQGVYHGG